MEYFGDKVERPKIWSTSRRIILMPARFTNAMYCDPTSVAYMPRRYMKFTLSVQFQH